MEGLWTNDDDDADENDDEKNLHTSDTNSKFPRGVWKQESLIITKFQILNEEYNNLKKLNRSYHDYLHWVDPIEITIERKVK